MTKRLLRMAGRLALLLVLVALLAAVSWQIISLFAADGQALAPVVGQYYLGDNWMSTPTPPPTPTMSPTALPTPTPRPSPTPLPTPTPGAAAGAEPTPTVVLPTPDPYVVAVAQDHGIDPAATYVIVNQNAQRMTIVESGLVVRTLSISTGDPDRGWYTPAWSGTVGDFWGTFSANGVSADDAWYLFKAGGSILIHSLPYTLAEDGSKIYQGKDELGVFPASRGCIRIDPEDARWFTEWGPGGIPIVVLPWDGGTGRSG